MTQVIARYSSRTRLIVTISLLSIVFLVYYGSDTQWASRGHSYGIYRLIPRIPQLNLSDFANTFNEDHINEFKAPALTESSISDTPSTATTSSITDNLSSTSSFNFPMYNKNTPVLYRKRPSTAHVDCSKALANDKEYMKTLSAKRITYKEPSQPMDCPSVRQRVLPPKALKPTGFGIAFVRVVFRDYEYLEDEVRSLFHPENLFCFTLDIKSSNEFKERMRQLANCFPNMLVAQKELSVDSAGHNINAGHYECLQLLYKKPNWQYVILLQNHDMIIRTTYELVALYKEMGGANDVELTPCPDSRIPAALKNKTFREMKLFRNESLVTEKQLDAKLRFAKGAAQASLSRAAVNWMMEVINMTVLIDAFNSLVSGNNYPKKSFWAFGADEQLMETLQVSTELDMPGRFTHECVDKRRSVDFVSRMSHWTYTSGEGCASGLTRHAICLLGLEDLYSISKYPNIMVNKFMPDFDFAGIDCVHELIFNRTHIEPTSFNTTYYQEMVNVKFHKARTISPNFEPPVSCTPTAKVWSAYTYP